jgi:hypothetical protein
VRAIAVAANRLRDRFLQQQCDHSQGTPTSPQGSSAEFSCKRQQNNVELNQPGIATTRSENVPESSRYCSLRQIGMISENANATPRNQR